MKFVDTRTYVDMLRELTEAGKEGYGVLSAY